MSADAAGSPRRATATRETADHELRLRIIHAATELLTEKGQAAVTTRAVAARAGISAPTIFRLFGEKDGLLSAVAEHGYAQFVVAGKRAEPSGDAVEDLRIGWTAAVQFGLDQPDLFLLIYGEPRSAAMATAAQSGQENLLERLRRVAAAGRLRVDVLLGADILQATARGAVFTALARPERPAGVDFVAALRDAAIAAITTDAPVLPEPGRQMAARTLKANLPGQTALSASEQQLLLDWLDRLSHDTSG